MNCKQFAFPHAKGNAYKKDSLFFRFLTENVQYIKELHFRIRTDKIEARGDSMLPYQRLYDIFHAIYNNHMTLPAKLSSHFTISIRTLRSDITLLNDILRKHGAKIVLKRGEGYSFDIHDTEAFQKIVQTLQLTKNKTMNLETADSRIRYLFLYLISKNEYISYEELADAIYVSNATLHNYLKSVTKSLEEYHIEMIVRASSAVKLIGDEQDKRRCIMDTLLRHDHAESISGFTREEQRLFPEIDLDELKQILFDVFQLEDITMTDMNLKNLTIHIALMLLRIQQANYVNYKKLNTIHIAFKNALSTIINIMEDHYHVQIDEDEKEYLYLHIISNADCNLLECNDTDVASYVANFLDFIYQDYNFDLRSDTILLEDLLKHMNSILSTKSLNLKKKNPLLNTIRNNFPLPFEITLTCISKAFSTSPFFLTEDDAGYIALHVGAAIERCFSGKYKAKNVILVSDGSHATSRILEARLKNYYTNKIEICKMCSCAQLDTLSPEVLETIDFLISTTALKKATCPVIIVDFALKNQDIEAITKLLNTMTINKWKQTAPFFDEQLFLMKPMVDNKQVLLEEMCALLQTHHIVEDNFLASVIEREDLAKTNINEVFALPHAIKLYANETKVVVVILDKPLMWHNEETVQIIFLLATKQNEQVNVEHLYDIVIEIVNNTSLQKRILKVQNFQEFTSVLSEYI